MKNPEIQSGIVLGQKYAYATVALVLGIACFTNLLGLEKAILAIVFGLLALKSDPAPALADRRTWAKVGIGLGAFLLVTIPSILLFNWHRIELIIDALRKLQTAK